MKLPVVDSKHAGEARTHQRMTHHADMSVGDSDSDVANGRKENSPLQVVDRGLKTDSASRNALSRPVCRIIVQHDP